METRDAAREAEITRLIDHLENGPLDGSHLGAAAKHLAALLAEIAALRRERDEARGWAAFDQLTSAIMRDAQRLGDEGIVKFGSQVQTVMGAVQGYAMGLGFCSDWMREKKRADEAEARLKELLPTPPAGGAHG